MKKIFLAIFLSVTFANVLFAADFDYQKVYRNLIVPKISYLHNIDPDQQFDTKGYTWSPYPLFRLSSPLYFKKISIAPGYYSLTPREHEDKYYILFKEAGKVRHIIPAYKREFVPEGFYEKNLPQPKLTFSQKLEINTSNFIGKWFPSAKRKPFPKSYLEVTDLDNNFVSIVIYYQEFRYYTVFRTVKL